MLQPDTSFLFTSPTHCILHDLIQESLFLTKKHPEILKMINDDLDAVALQKKVKRIELSNWESKQQHDELIEVEELKTLAPKTLLSGRKRTPTQIIVAGIFIRGYYGSVTSKHVRDRLCDSLTYKEFLWQFGLDYLDPTVLARHINNLSDQTLDYLYTRQLRQYNEEKLDDFKIFSTDSTSIRANAAWPSDSKVIASKLRTALNILLSFLDRNLCSFNSRWPKTWSEEIINLSREIDFCCGKKGAANKRKILYQELLDKAKKLAVKLDAISDKIKPEMLSQPLNPVKQGLLEKAFKRFETNLLDSFFLIDYTWDRTQLDIKSKRDPEEEHLAVDERDARIIRKGQRQDNFGYKLQAGFSGNGLITALILDVGNTSDSASFLPLLQQTINRVEVTPKIGTVDDGYSAAENWQEATEVYKLEVMSISGAKGRKLLGEEIYNSQEYKNARNIRGKYEFPFFILKHMQDMQRMKRVGVKAVRREITEKVIAFNTIRAIQLRKQMSEERHQKVAA